MKQVILDVLEDVAGGQVNLKSEAARKMIVNLIMASIKTKGWYLNLGTHHDGKLDTAGHPVKKIDKWLSQDIDEAMIHEEQIKDTWICGICNESTYAVEYDYMGSGTNHLECELKIEMKNSNDGHREPPYNSFIRNKEELEKLNDL